MPFKPGASGNPSGRPTGILNKRNEQWDALAESITGGQAEKFRKYLNKLWDSTVPEDHDKAADFFLKTVEYFKPKQQKVTATVDGEMSVIFGRRDAPDRDPSK